MTTVIKQHIRESIQTFAKGRLTENALNLFKTLGYNTERRGQLDKPSYAVFKESFIGTDSKFNEEKALFEDWEYIDLLFQLTKEELNFDKKLFKKEVITKLPDGKEDRAIIETYLFFAIELSKDQYSRTELSRITREVNHLFPMPVMILFKIGGCLTLSVINRRLHKKDESKDVLEKVTLIKDIRIENPHRAHIEILFDLSFDELLRVHRFTNFVKLHNAWEKTLSLSVLNEKFYKDLQNWFYFAVQNIKLPFKPGYIDEKENIKNFLVRLLARTMFCWFVKEKGLIRKELLELTDGTDNKYPLTYDIDSENFLQSNSYYRGILQNIFFNALNQKDKKSAKVFKWTKYLHPDFSYDWLTSIPYLNGGIFDKLEEDNAKESIEDSVIKVPNFLFYGKTKEQVATGRRANARAEKSELYHKGLNDIFKSYKFTLEENTPVEEVVALDPELPGLVFENLLAELDPNLEESTVRSIRKLTGSYYTPKKCIREMVNDSLFLYLTKYIKKNYPQLCDVRSRLVNLVYHNVFDDTQSDFCIAVVNGLDKFKMLDPACGSGAFPMGMLNRMVEILKLVDRNNQLWLELKLKTVDAAQRTEFKKVLTLHLDDYGRKLGIIRDSIYGIDIQPLAVQITKLRFFIALLIDQRTEKGITPMPNIETKIICADSLKNIQADMFSPNAIEKLREARVRYYQPDISYEERAEVIEEIVSTLDRAFPDFARQITGKNIPGQNKILLKEWFTHATIAAPFFNIDFFYPELKETGGFDCVIGNPPYGGNKISDDIRNTLCIESKDPYGAFIARFLNAADKPSPLKHGGVLAFIVSDTFMTIKSHLKLRKLMMQNYIHKMLRMNPDTFRATVNTAIIICERNVYPKDKNGKYIPTFNKNHICQMADLTNISIHDNYDRFVEVLNQTKGVDFAKADTHKAESNIEFAIYYYPQSLIATNSNLPFFVASPKLFCFMNDKNQIISHSNIAKITFEVLINGKQFVSYYLGDDYTGSGHTRDWNNIGILKTISGIKTGDNDKFIYKTEKGRGSYHLVPFEKVIEDTTSLNSSEKLNGIIPKERNGKFIVPLDKGGESCSADGWMPNYYVATDYYIDWSEKAVSEMKKEPHSDLANVEFRFKIGLTYSRTGIYAPTFRINSGGILESKSCGLFTDRFPPDLMLGILNSRIVKYIIKNYVMHTIESSVGTLPLTPIILPNSTVSNIISQLVNQIINKQNKIARYDYASHEQIEIDKIIYETYGLNAEDIEEVENWHVRRYPKLSAAQKENLRKFGKSDDYLVLYGLKQEN